MDARPGPLTVNELIDQRPLSRFQISTIGLCTLVLLLDGFDTQSVGFLVPPISEELGIPLSSFGPMLSAGLVGLMIGAMSAGPIADRWGRRPAIIASVFVFGGFSLLTAQARSLNALIALRFLTGLGLGGAMPNVVALASEYAPKRLQATLVSGIFVGMGGGAIAASLVGRAMIPLWGWRSVFYCGGILPLVLALVLIKALPESVRFLCVRGGRPERVAAIVARIAPGLRDVPVNLETSGNTDHEGLAVRHLFVDGRTPGTVLLWMTFFMNLLILYFILSWLPALLRQAGMAVSAGITAVLIFSVGGVLGTILQGPLLRLLGAYVGVMTQSTMTVLLVALGSTIFATFPLMMVVTFVLGVCVQGLQATLNALAAMYYPTVARSTGVGWALGVGRIGSIVGPLIGGVMLSLQWTPQQIFLAGTIPAFVAVGAILVSGQLQGDASPYRPPTESSGAAVPSQRS